MTIQIELSPEMEWRLAGEARAQGLDLEAYAQRLIESALDVRPEHRPRATHAEFQALLHALESKDPTPAALHSATFSREMIYDQRD